MDIIENRDAQFMLLAGFIIAVGLVITTMLLNSIAFEGNMAGEAGGDPIKYDIANLMAISADEVKSAYRNVTELGGNNTQKINNFTRQAQNFRGNLSKIYAMRGEGVNVTWDVSNWNNTRYANFTDNGTAGGAGNWTVMQNVSSSNIIMNVTVISGTFQIGLVNVSYPSWINLTTGTYPSLIIINATTNPPDPYSIVFRNGSIASGNYSITGTASGRNFIRARDYILDTTLTLSTSRVRVNLTIPVSVPW